MVLHIFELAEKKISFSRFCIICLTAYKFLLKSLISWLQQKLENFALFIYQLLGFFLFDFKVKFQDINVKGK